MPLPSYHNVSDEAAVVLVRQGDEIGKVSNIAITNTLATGSIMVDLYIGHLATGETSRTAYYIIKQKFLHIGETIMLQTPILNFTKNNSLIIQLSSVQVADPTADVLLK